MNLGGFIVSACSAGVSVIIFALIMCIDAIGDSTRGPSKTSWVIVILLEGLLAFTLGRFFVAGIGLVLIACGLAMSIYLLKEKAYNHIFLFGGITATFVGLLLFAVPALAGYLVLVPGMF